MTEKELQNSKLHLAESCAKGKYPNTFYRVSLKAIIRNEDGLLLVVKESGGDSWDLPGGGMGHGETDMEALQRELYEEVAIVDDFTATVEGIDSMWIESRQGFLMWVVYTVSLIGEGKCGVGRDADDVAFVDPSSFKDSTHLFERFIYKWTVDREYNAQV